jgi:hypothetical protein
MHLVTVKVKVDSSLLIKIIISIKVILFLVKGFYLFQNLNTKLSSTIVLRRKEVKRVLYFVPALKGVYLPASCTKATVIIHESLSLAVVNCE